MEHLGISNTAVSTGAVMVVGVTADRVSYYSGFGIWHMERPPKKLATTFFELSAFILGVRFKVYLSLQKVRKSFSICEVTMCILLYNLLYQFSQFSLPMERLELQKQKMAELLSRDHLHELPVVAFHELCILLKIFQFRTKFKS